MNTLILGANTRSYECDYVQANEHVCDVCVSVYTTKLCVGECRVIMNACADVCVFVFLVNSLYTHQVMSVSMCTPMSTCVMFA